MAQHGKKYRQARAAIDREKEYPPVEAIKMLKAMPAVRRCGSRRSV